MSASRTPPDSMEDRVRQFLSTVVSAVRQRPTAAVLILPTSSHLGSLLAVVRYYTEYSLRCYDYILVGSLSSQRLDRLSPPRRSVSPCLPSTERLSQNVGPTPGALRLLSRFGRPHTWRSSVTVGHAGRSDALPS
ncbi:unnamed protein product [Heligmosomoides polygyrus]|uniref:SLC12 domain-containing protein n=1 Tax=Heligmosomoides polygyrus TaxID=6339 RepID=A0A183FVM1_HELPZ|nr:unnamed protein product [Heligmosomoides polygyrus]